MFTLTATTRRIASAKGNYLKGGAIIRKQYPECNSDRKKTVSEPSEEIKKLQRKMNLLIKEWYDSGGKNLLNLGEDAENWNTVMDLVERLYDPVFSIGHLPSTLCDSSSIGAAIFAAFATVIEEKLSVLCGEEGILLRSKNNSAALTDTLLSNDKLAKIFKLRKDKMTKRQSTEQQSTEEKNMLMYRISKLKDAPLPHRLSLFEKFGHETSKEEISSNLSTLAGTTVASDMHCKLVNHVFKVAFRKSGPGKIPQRRMAETHPLSKYLLECMDGQENFYSHDPDNASIFYCDYDDFKAYQALPPELKMSSIVPGSYNMEDLPFRPFAVPLHYKTSKRIFKYERAVPLDSSMCFDYGEFLCYCVFGDEWDKHLGDVVDALGHSSMNVFNPNIFSGIFCDLHDFNRLGSIRFGVVDFALRSVAEFIRSEAYNAANKAEEEEEAAEENALSVLRNAIRKSVRQIRSFLREDLPDIIFRFKQDLPAGDYGQTGEFECLTAHLFLIRLLDECHILRNTEIQRTVFSTRMSLSKRDKIEHPRRINVQTYSSIEKIPEGVRAGLLGDEFTDAGRAVVSWDGSTGKVIGVWQNVVTGHYLFDHESLAKKYKDEMNLVKKIKCCLREASEEGSLNPSFFSREAIYSALQVKGIFLPGLNLTETDQSFRCSERKKNSESINTRGMVGPFSGFPIGQRIITGAKTSPVKKLPSLSGPEFTDTWETYPDLGELKKLVKDFEKIIPQDEIREIKKISIKTLKYQEELEQKVNDTKLSKIVDLLYAKKLGNGVSVLVGRYGTVSVSVGTATAAGFLGPAMLETMNASRGFHINVALQNQVTTYKIANFANENERSREIDTVTIHEGSRSKDQVLMCAENGAVLSDCRVTVQEPYFDFFDMYKGRSLTCSSGITAMLALVDTLKILDANSFSCLIEKPVTEDMLYTVINSPAFIVTAPFLACIAATKLRLGEWTTRLAVGLAVFLLILAVRFFAGSPNDKSSRNYTQEYESGKKNCTDIKKCIERRVFIKLKPAFLPAITSYMRTAKIIGAHVTLFSDCYKDVKHICNRQCKSIKEQKEI